MNRTFTTYILDLIGKNSFFPILFFSAFFISSCSGKHGGAQTFLNEAELAYSSGNYSLAKLKVDSIRLEHPQAFEAIRAGQDLMQKIRMAENIRNIRFCDSMLEVNYTSLNSLKKKFKYERDPHYQEFGYYTPISFPLTDAFNQSSLRAAVSEKGQLYIESVWMGGSINHNKIKVATKDGAFVESLVVTDDGLNYKINTLDKRYEIVRFQGNDDNGVALFIFTYKDSPLTLTFMGGNNRSIPLSNKSKEAVAITYEMSALLLEIENLKYEKGRSEALIQYLESKM